jgi:hypothetical protein
MSRKECTECKWFPCHDKKDTHSWCDKQWHEILAHDCKYYERDTSEPSTDTPPVPTPGMATAATHYSRMEPQPIEIMQRSRPKEQFIGFLICNLIKYILRLGYKDDIKKEVGKIVQYALWLQQAVNGETIKP